MAPGLPTLAVGASPQASRDASSRPTRQSARTRVRANVGDATATTAIAPFNAPRRCPECGRKFVLRMMGEETSSPGPTNWHTLSVSSTNTTTSVR
jgi:hypothetical protein